MKMTPKVTGIHLYSFVLCFQQGHSIQGLLAVVVLDLAATTPLLSSYHCFIVQLVVTSESSSGMMSPDQLH